MRVFLSIPVLCIALLGCQPISTPAPTPTSVLDALVPALSSIELPRTLKGWELYSWQKDHQWHFVLTAGTNRLKSHQEILADDARVTGAAALKTRLAQLPQGEQIFWTALPDSPFQLPDQAIIQDLESYLSQRGITLTILTTR